MNCKCPGSRAFTTIVIRTLLLGAMVPASGCLGQEEGTADGDLLKEVEACMRWFGPLAGRVKNRSNRPVTVWSPEKDVYAIPAHSESSYWFEDVDHIQDWFGQWYKIGANEVVVEPDGRIHGYTCMTPTYGVDCPEHHSENGFGGGAVRVW